MRLINSPTPRRPLAYSAVIGVAIGLLSAAPAESRVKWLCNPGHKPDPCRDGLKTTVIASDGSRRVVTPTRARHPKIDCFYVYPTVSEQPTVNSNLRIEPQETAIAHWQASRFSQVCRVFAPMYRALTIFGSRQSTPIERRAAKIAYADIRAAWRSYLARYNDGRGVVLIGHSQGAALLIKLARRSIDPKPAVRRKLVAALVPGGNLLVKKGRKVGGDFRRIPGCRSRSQTGCVIAYSMFNETPPLDSFYGRSGGDRTRIFGGAKGRNLRVLCTNPAVLSGDRGALRTYLPTAALPGVGGIIWRILLDGSLPTAPTPWIVPQDRYRAGCRRSNGANILRIFPRAGARHLTPVRRFGLHFADINLALGNLVRIVKSEARAYAKHR